MAKNRERRHQNLRESDSPVPADRGQSWSITYPQSVSRAAFPQVSHARICALLGKVPTQA